VPADVNIPGWGLHVLKGQFANHWSVSVSGDWRFTFSVEDGDAVLVNHQGYH